MEIKCPECGFAREVQEDKIPPTAKTATCPKCGQKFIFRKDPPEFAESQEEWTGKEEEPGKPGSENRDAQAPEEDIWSQLESLSDEGPEGEEYKEHKAWQQRKRAAGTQNEIPWENLQNYGFFPGLIETIKLVMFQPQSFFARLPLGRGYIQPLIFYLLLP
ncbi:MAG: zinc-ribbon domain-containing protein, partial [Desulfovermiculus sp.]|nr:zinc-ribbon domain-containing protein [Desulfovermiculus sp.]